jgi:hypothetical protein
VLVSFPLLRKSDGLSPSSLQWSWSIPGFVISYHTAKMTLCT